jgi:outer membrane receptor protein involved in Fe transport
MSDIPWDSFDVGRVDLQRGPNSILFGIGSPAGIINASVNTAGFMDSGSVENRFGSFGTLRDSLDVNHVLLKNELAFRIAALDDLTMYRQQPAYNHDKRAFAAVRWDPKLFDTESAHTTIRFNFEGGEVHSNNPHVLPPTDRITPFFDPNADDKTVYDGNWVGSVGIDRHQNNAATLLPGLAANYWLTQYPGVMADGPNFLYNNLTSPSAPTQVYNNNQGTPKSIDTSGNVDGGNIDGLNGLMLSQGVGLGDYNDWATVKQNNEINVGLPVTRDVSSADKGFYKDYSIKDPSIFDFYNHMLDGPNSWQAQRWSASNLSIEQSFFHNRLAFQAVYDRQVYHQAQESNGGDFITVDIQANARDQGWAAGGSNVTMYSGTPAGQTLTNPNAGAAFTSGTGDGGSHDTDRESFRFTGTGELRASDLIHRTWLSDLLGRHVITALYSTDKYGITDRSWQRYGAGLDYALAIGYPAGNATGTPSSSNRGVGWVDYLSGPLFNVTNSTGAGIHLQPITTLQSPSGMASVTYFDSTWNKPTDPTNPNYVDPAAPYILRNAINGNVFPYNTVANGTNGSPAIVETQSENPDNYKGWTTVPTRILNADKGDIDALTTAASKIQIRTTSQALTWQGYLWDDTLAATFGWRRDVQKQRSGEGTTNPTNGSVSTSFGLDPVNPETGVEKGESKSWGLVLHEPKAIRNLLPWGTNLSLVYDQGENERVENRYGFYGNPLPPPRGFTTDYGFVLSTLNDRLQLKVTWYKTTVKDADIASVTTDTSSLGSLQYRVTSLEYWGTCTALLDDAYLKGVAPGNYDYSGYAYWDHSGQTNQNAYQDPTADPALHDPSTVKEAAAVNSWLSQMMPQAWFDKFGMNLDVAKAVARDYKNTIPGWDASAPGAYVNFNTGSGTVNGLPPTGTVDNQSKGIEFELTGQLLKNWNVSINASKQTAQETSLGTDISSFIVAQHAKFASPAGDLRLWWGNDVGLSQYYAPVWASYQFQLQTAGKMVPEMSPWRVNAVTNYSFDRGLLKGFNIGGGYRWQQGVILGYLLNDAGDNLDINKPVWGKSTYAVDLWAGYGRKLTRKLDWRIQLNVRGVGSRAHLEAISVQPNGDPANFRIVEGQTWELTNTFSF